MSVFGLQDKHGIKVITVFLFFVLTLAMAGVFISFRQLHTCEINPSSRCPQFTCPTSSNAKSSDLECQGYPFTIDASTGAKVCRNSYEQHFSAHD